MTALLDWPTLTMVNLPNQHIAEQAANLLFSPNLLVRESTARAGSNL